MRSNHKFHKTGCPACAAAAEQLASAPDQPDIVRLPGETARRVSGITQSLPTLFYGERAFRIDAGAVIADLK